jgi:hypothetical protein
LPFICRGKHCPSVGRAQYSSAFEKRVADPERANKKARSGRRQRLGGRAPPPMQTSRPPIEPVVTQEARRERSAQLQSRSPSTKRVTEATSMLRAEWESDRPRSQREIPRGRAPFARSTSPHLAPSCADLRRPCARWPSRRESARATRLPSANEPMSFETPRCRSLTDPHAVAQS